MERVKRKMDKLWLGKAGEADRCIGSAKPKHLYSGKRSNGSNDRR